MLRLLWRSRRHSPFAEDPLRGLRPPNPACAESPPESGRPSGGAECSRGIPGQWYHPGIMDKQAYVEFKICTVRRQTLNTDQDEINCAVLEANVTIEGVAYDNQLLRLQQPKGTDYTEWSIEIVPGGEAFRRLRRDSLAEAAEDYYRTTMVQVANTEAGLAGGGMVGLAGVTGNVVIEDPVSINPKGYSVPLADTDGGGW